MPIDQERLSKQIEALKTVQHIALELMSELDSWSLLNRILNTAIEVLNAATGSLMLWVPPDELEWAVSADQKLIGQRMPADKGIAGWVFTNEQPLIVRDVQGDSRFFQEIDPDFETESLIAVPLMTPTERIGVVEVLNKKSGEMFDEQDRDILIALSAQAATAIVNARLYQELQEEKNRIVEMEGQLHRKLARDLHDGPAQTLSVMIMDVDIILRMYERAPEKVPEELKRLRQAASKSLAQVRNTMFELRPLVLETQGLRAALKSYVERLASTEDMPIHLDVRNLQERLPGRIERLCFDIIQEAVTNVKKHARAENTWIVAERNAKSLVIAVRDDGRGFDVQETEQDYDRRGSMGLLNMRERAEMLGARYAIESVPDKGTLVSLIVPLAKPYPPPKNARVRREESSAPQHRVGGTEGKEQKRRRKKGTGPLVLLNHHREPEPQSEQSS